MARRSPTVRRTKEEICEAALSLFCEFGYHEVTIDDIAARAGVTKGAVYYYFVDKEDLAKDLWHDMWERLGVQARTRIDPSLGVATNLKRSFRAVLEGISSLGEAQFFLRDAWVLPAVEVVGRDDQRSAVGLLAILITDGIARGELDSSLDIGAITAVLLGIYSEAVLHILNSGESEPTLILVDRVVDVILEGKNSKR